MRGSDRYTPADVRCEVAGTSLAVANLSLGGFFLASESPLPAGQSVVFTLAFPDGFRVEAVGRVAWVNGPEGARTPGLPCGFGITITQIAFPAKLALVARVRALAATVAPAPRLRHARPRKPPGPRRPR